MISIKDLFLLDPKVTFLNHGSFGACPRPVFEDYQSWQRELERQPVEFLGRRAEELLATARARLAEFVSAAPDEIVYFPNPTTALNMVARSLELQPGDEILTTDHEYGALNRTWHFICSQTGASYIRHPIPLPVSSTEQFVESFWGAVNPNTRVIFISHISSPTALIFPIEQICQRAQQAGILTIVDGAHAPGQIRLDLHALGADIYSGACHKWLMAPKSAAFLYARRAVQDWLMPLVVSWGYESEHPSASRFIDYHEWQGTRDLAAFLSVPAAIDFQAEYNWEKIREDCHALAVAAQRRLTALTGLEPLCPDFPLPPAGHRWFRQMFCASLPQHVDLDDLKMRLYQEYAIEVPTIFWNGQKLLRVSVQGYNTKEDLEALCDALPGLLG